jgi:hypothetical protein
LGRSLRCASFSSHTRNVDAFNASTLRLRSYHYNQTRKNHEHMSFHLPDMATLRKALKHLKNIEADLEDPGDEIGPEAPGSPHMGLWVHDPDGYRWELSVQDHGP